MNGVPGVMTLLSNASDFTFGARGTPSASISARSRASSTAFSSASLAALKRRDRCWFILARGATPSAGGA